MPIEIAVISFFANYVDLLTSRLSQFVFLQLRIKFADLRTISFLQFGLLQGLGNLK